MINLTKEDFIKNYLDGKAKYMYLVKQYENLEKRFDTYKKSVEKRIIQK